MEYVLTIAHYAMHSNFKPTFSQFGCYNTPLLRSHRFHGSIVDQAGMERLFIDDSGGCACGKNDTCYMKGRQCNCDASPLPNEWLFDTGTNIMIDHGRVTCTHSA